MVSSLEGGGTIHFRMRSRQALLVASFHRAMHSHEIPCNKKSRAYAALKYCWRVRVPVPAGCELGKIEMGGRGPYGEDSNDSDGDSGSGGVLLSSAAAMHPYAMFQGKEQSKTSDEVVEVVEVAEVAEVTEVEAEGKAEAEGGRTKTITKTTNTTTDLYDYFEAESGTKNFTQSEGKVESEVVVEAVLMHEAKYEEERSSSSSISNSGSSSSTKGRRIHDDDEEELSRGRREATTMNEKGLDKNLELDEMDALLLGFDRGPPPSRFLCGLTGEIMSDPLQHPRLDNVWVDRESLEQYYDSAMTKMEEEEMGMEKEEERRRRSGSSTEGRSSERRKVRWPGAPGNVEPFLPDDLATLSTDVQLRIDIQQWQVRKSIGGGGGGML